MFKIRNIAHSIIASMSFLSIVASANFDNIEKKLEQKQATLKREFKNVSYENKKDNYLPKIYEENEKNAQIFFCHNGSTGWLEFTNYEFMINGRESNKLVTIVIGKSIEDAKNEKNVTKETIEILDPELSFVLQDAILKYWDKINTANIKSLPLINVAHAIQVGYNALDYHLGFTDVIDTNCAVNILNLNDLIELIKTKQQNYKEHAMFLNRFITFDDIKKKKALGFIAYYPNPIYLNDIAWYIRPSNMTYQDYAKYSQSDMPTLDDTEILSRNYIKSLEHNDYYDILKRLYPQKSMKLHPKNQDIYFIYCDIEIGEKTNGLRIVQEKIKNIKDTSYDVLLCGSGSMLYLAQIQNGEVKKINYVDIVENIDETIKKLKNKNTTDVNIKLTNDEISVLKANTQLTKYYSDFRTISYEDFRPLPPAYVFRGDDRDLEDISKAGGFWVLPHYVENIQYDAKNNLEAVKKIDDVWKVKECRFDICSAGTAYLASSRKFDFANTYGYNTYALFTTDAIDLPSMYENNNTHNLLHNEAIIPVGVDWKNVAGVRHKENRLLVGPVFLKNSLETNDVDNFWKMLQLFGGKSQANKKKQIEFINSICQGEFNVSRVVDIFGHDKEITQAMKDTGDGDFTDLETDDDLQLMRSQQCPQLSDAVIGLQTTMR